MISKQSVNLPSLNPLLTILKFKLAKNLSTIAPAHLQTQRLRLIVADKKSPFMLMDLKI